VLLLCTSLSFTTHSGLGARAVFDGVKTTGTDGERYTKSIGMGGGFQFWRARMSVGGLGKVILTVGDGFSVATGDAVPDGLKPPTSI
jgi:hypothetical protein